MFKTPILFLIFNRPDTTIKVFEAIREIKPAFLYVAADGPRKDKPGEAEKCEQIRDIVMKGINWDCEVKTLFREKNLGCGLAVSSAITWFFENVEEGIILEDDCLPNQSFFLFCETLLEYYRNDDQIFVVSGDNFQKEKVGDASYYFSAYSHIWGWATWRRVWNKYSFSLIDINDEVFKNCLTNYFSSVVEQKYWFQIFQKMKYNPIDTWDYQLAFSQWFHGGKTILPNTNLVSNIGFNEQGTHTTIHIEGKSNLKSYAIEKITHPVNQQINKDADSFSFKTHYNLQISILKRIKNKIRRILN